MAQSEMTDEPTRTTPAKTERRVVPYPWRPLSAQKLMGASVSVR